MKIVFFVHSIASDWNHGNAHFLRGLMSSLAARGHEVESWERAGAWSAEHLVEDAGTAPIVAFARTFPEIGVRSYRLDDDLPATLSEAVADADAVIVHEWNEPAVVGLLGLERRNGGGFPLLFHDTHHRPVSQPAAIARFALDRYDGVLAFGDSLRHVYRERFGVSRAWTFHEAADTRRFRPLEREKDTDVIWIGNWGDEERSEELRRFWLDSARSLPALRFAAHGTRYPEEALEEVEAAGVDFRGWIPSREVPERFAESRVTLHIPRRLYQQSLPGIPTIRPFEALACGIPLVSTPWEDSEGLFRPGDFTVAETPSEMRAALERLVTDEDAAAGEALADVVVGVALELERHAVGEERAEALAGGAGELEADGVVGQTVAAVSPHRPAGESRNLSVSEGARAGLQWSASRQGPARA